MPEAEVPARQTGQDVGPSGATPKRALETEADPSAGHSRVQPLWTRSYALVCLSNFLSYSNQTMLMPVLPLFLVSVGQTPAFVGFTITIYSVTSFVLRPWIGYSVDRWSPRRAYSLGALLSSVTSFALVIPSIAALVVVRAVGGFGWAAINTAGTTMAADLAPVARRGEALGYYTMMTSLAKTVMPAAGLWFAATHGYPETFILAGALGIGAVFSSMMIQKAPGSGASDGPSRRPKGVPERGVMLPTFLSTLMNMTNPITTSFIVLYAAERGIVDIWAFFVAGGIAAIAFRLAGRFSDRFGRLPILAAGFAATAVSLVIMLWATTLAELVVAGVLYSVGQSLASPAAMAMVVDRTTQGRRGTAMATYTASFPLGIGLGAVAWGVSIEWWGYGSMFLGGVAVLLIGLVVLAANWGRARSPHAPGLTS